MQRRFIASILGGVLGILLAWRLPDALGVSVTLTYIACAFAGIAIAYVVSMLLDVFAGSPGTTPE